MPDRFFCHECNEVLPTPVGSIDPLTEHYSRQHGDLYNRLQIFVMYDEAGRRMEEDCGATRHDIEVWFNGRNLTLVHDSDGDWGEYDGEEDNGDDKAWIEWGGLFLFSGRAIHLSYRVTKCFNTIEAVIVEESSYRHGAIHPHHTEDWQHPIVVEIHEEDGMRAIHHCPTGRWERAEEPEPREPVTG